MGKTDKLIENMKEDSELSSKRNLLIVVSMLLMAMSVSGATLLEANTFIFKIGFENSKGLGYLLFLGVVTLTIRYYSVAYQYHVQLYDMWANEMIRDYSVFGYSCDDEHWVTPRGLLSNIEIFSRGFQESQDEGENARNEFVFKYEVLGFFRRAVSYTSDCGDYYSTERVSLNSFKDGWKIGNLFQLLMIEFKYQSAAFFRRTEHLEILLPYMISVLSLFSFTFKSNIQILMQ